MILFRKSSLVMGRIEKRYKRFLADVVLENGEQVTAHSTNTGTMKSCWEQGDRVLLERAHNPLRKLPFTWIACEREGHWVGVDTGLPNKLVAQALRDNTLPGLQSLSHIKTEVKYGEEGSRIDVMAQSQSGQTVYVEIKNTTLKRGDHVLFPDAVSTRAAKHLRELQAMVRQGHRAVIVFLIQRGDTRVFDAAWEIDPDYATGLDQAARQGVEVLPIQVALEPHPTPEAWEIVWRWKGLLPWSQRPR